MPGRIEPPAGAINRYKYGFNGKENDKETVGTGEGTQDYGFRIYNPALGKFLSVDPLTKSFSMLTPYQFASNSPVAAIDLDGLEGFVSTGVIGYGTTHIQGDVNNDFIVDASERKSAFMAMGAMIGFGGVTGIGSVFCAEFIGSVGIPALTYLQTPQGQQTGVEVAGFVGNLFLEGPDEVQTPGPGNELAKAAKFLYSSSGKAFAKYLRGSSLEILNKSAKLWGGNVIDLLKNKTTTVLGKYYGGIEYIKASGKFRYGQNTGSINLLNVADDAYEKVIAEGGDELFWKTYNKPWLDEAIKRGDNIRIVSDPNNPKNLYKNGVDGEKTMFGREVEYLEDNKFIINNGTATKEN